jgi:hypothetical protein
VNRFGSVKMTPSAQTAQIRMTFQFAKYSID